MPALEVYDYSRSTWVRVGGTIQGTRVGLYDYERGCNVFGVLPHLWDDGMRCSFELHVSANTFRGTYGPPGRLFRGDVVGLEITLHDSLMALAQCYSLRALTVPGSPSSPAS